MTSDDYREQIARDLTDVRDQLRALATTIGSLAYLVSGAPPEVLGFAAHVDAETRVRNGERATCGEWFTPPGGGPNAQCERDRGHGGECYFVDTRHGADDLRHEHRH